MAKRETRKRDNTPIVILGKSTVFTGILKFASSCVFREFLREQ